MTYSRRELYAMGEPFGDSATRREVGGKVIYGGGGSGGGGTTYSEGTQYTSSVPKWLEGEQKEVVARGLALAQQPYQAYTGERVSQFTRLQRQAFGQAERQGVAGQLGAATGIAGLAAQQGLQAGQFFQPGAFNPMSVQAPSLQNFQMGPAMQVGAQRVGTRGIQGAQTGFNPALQAFQMGPAQKVSSRDVSTQGIQGAQTGFNPALQAFQMGPAQKVSSRDVSTQGIQAAQTGFRPDLSQFQMRGPESFTQAGTAEQFMNPFMQNVVDVQKREAQRAADIAGTQRGAQAVRAGAFGGTRQAVMEAEAQRNLAQQMGDIQATGSQAAFQQAQQQFNQEQQAMQQARQANLQARLGVQELGTQTGLQASLANLNAEQQARVQSEANRLQAQGMNQDAAMRSALANQQAGLTVGQQNLASQLGVQQLGTQTGVQTALANLSNEQQARVQSEANRLQAQGMNQDAAMRSALANQQAGLTVGQQNLASQLGVQQLGTQTGVQTALANLSNEQQARVQSEANRLQAQGMNQDAAMRAALANQQAGLNVGQQNLAAMLGIQQLGTGQSMQAQMANQQALMDAQRAFEQSRQFGADLGLRGGAQALQGAGILGQLGQQQFGQEMDIMSARERMGGTQQQQIQNILNQQYADFQAQRDFPYQQLGFASDLIQGRGGSTRSMYASPQTSPLQTIAGLGTVAAGLTRAKGGSIPKGKGYAEGGIMSLMGDDQLQQVQSPMDQMAAQEEMMRRQAIRDQAPASMPREADMTEAELLQAMQRAMQEGDRAKAAVIREIIEDRRIEDSGIAMIAPDEAGDIPDGGLAEMAGGGMVSFEVGGGVGSPLEMTDEEFRRRLLEEQAMGGGRGSVSGPTAEDLMAATRANPRMMRGLPALKPETSGNVSTQGGIADVMSPSQLMSAARQFGIDPEAAAERQMALAGQQAEARERALAQRQSDFERMVAERGVYGKEQEEAARAEIEGLTGKKVDSKNFALIQAGLAILSADPSRGAFAAIGEGAAKGLAGYKGDLEKLDATRDRINSRLDRILELRRAEQTADGRERQTLEAERSKLEELAIADHRQILGDMDKNKQGLGETMYKAHLAQRAAAAGRRDRAGMTASMIAQQRQIINSQITALNNKAKLEGLEPAEQAELDRLKGELSELSQIVGGRLGMTGQGGGGGGTVDTNNPLLKS